MPIASGHALVSESVIVTPGKYKVTFHAPYRSLTLIKLTARTQLISYNISRPHRPIFNINDLHYLSRSSMPSATRASSYREPHEDDILFNPWQLFPHLQCNPKMIMNANLALKREKLQHHDFNLHLKQHSRISDSSEP